MVITGEKRFSDMVDLEQVLTFPTEKTGHRFPALVIGRVHATRTRRMGSDGEKHLNGCLFPRKLGNAICLFPNTKCLLLHHVAVTTISIALDKADGGRDHDWRKSILHLDV